MDEIKVEYDIKDIGEAGFDSYLNRANFGAPEPVDGLISRYQSMRNLSGGLLSSESRLYMGNSQMYFDGGAIRFIVNDGDTDRVLIGRL